jgi:hypothetical protein
VYRRLPKILFGRRGHFALAPLQKLVAASAASTISYISAVFEKFCLCQSLVGHDCHQ